MWGISKSGGSRARTALVVSAFATLGCTACGNTGEFKNAPRPPVPIQLSGVVTDKQVTVSPNRIGGGPVRLIIANETNGAETIVLERTGNEGTPTRDVVGPLNPFATGTLQQDLTQGSYTVSVESNPAIQAETIEVGPQRSGSAGNLLLP